MERFFDILSFAAGALFERRRREFAGGGKNQRMSKNRGNERVFRGHIDGLSLRLLPLNKNLYTSYIIPITPPTTCTINAATHAIAHCQTTTPTAHLPPSSLFTEAIAATQGV